MIKIKKIEVDIKKLVTMAEMGLGVKRPLNKEKRTWINKLKKEKTWDPILITPIKDSGYYLLTDGWHRVQAAKKKKQKKSIISGLAFINATFNNTMITITDEQGNSIAWSSAGVKGFKGSRKSTPYAAQIAAEDAGTKAKEFGLKNLKVEVSGPGSGRESALRSLQSIGYIITSIKDVTPIPHNDVGQEKEEEFKKRSI